MEQRVEMESVALLTRPTSCTSMAGCNECGWYASGGEGSPKNRRTVVVVVDASCVWFMCWKWSDTSNWYCLAGSFALTTILLLSVPDCV